MENSFSFFFHFGIWLLATDLMYSYIPVDYKRRSIPVDNETLSYIPVDTMNDKHER